MVSMAQSPRDHPRGCGEKPADHRDPAALSGSSPRVRGEDSSFVIVWSPLGIIPAGAGRSSEVVAAAAAFGDHPRGCGEKPTCASGIIRVLGSSPRVRGEGVVNHGSVSSLGIIPAGAGRSTSSRRATPRFGDHPRGCGEKLRGRRGGGGLRGSSPRVRGEAHLHRSAEGGVGIIPAGAGRSRGRPIPHKRGRDHPRGCGEKTSASAASRRPMGSSPRVRGEGLRRCALMPLPGIIPAGAGRRLWQPFRPPFLWDHPRGCGEKPSSVTTIGKQAGSSPRVRGEAPLPKVARCLSGIIPAGAGRSKKTTSWWWCARDHPRGCGEKCRRRCRRAPTLGSSPRVRGEAGFRPGGQPGRGIIPAGAGRRKRPSCPPSALRDHPRGCGEKLRMSAWAEAEAGSSPRVRGEGPPRLPSLQGRGIIPAGAGRSGFVVHVRRPFGDHPRGCGEKASRRLWSAHSRGSSPRVRGEVVHFQQKEAGAGIIPAGAGRRTQ